MATAVSFIRLSTVLNYKHTISSPCLLKSTCACKWLPALVLLNSIPDGPFSWEISPQTGEKRAASNYKSRPGDENGSRIYQLVLKRMELLPSNLPGNNIVEPSPSDKGKKRAAIDIADYGPSTPKKARREFAELTDDISMGEIGEAGEGSLENI